MVACEYCGDGVAMPYKCSLCGNKYCGKHRLAESHECINQNVYRDPSYVKQKLTKDREIQHVKAGRDPTTGKQMYRGESRGTTLRSLWQADRPWKTALYGGVILGVAEGTGILIFNFGAAAFLTLIILAIIGGLGFVLVNSLRQRKANSIGGITYFVIWPIGIAITLITSLFRFTFYTFGYFTTSGPSLKDEADVAKNSLYSFLGLFLFFNILSSWGPYFVDSLASFSLIFRASSSMFLVFGFIMFIPWAKLYSLIFGREYPVVLDGDKLYENDSRDYWYHFFGIVLLFLLSRINWVSMLTSQ